YPFSITLTDETAVDVTTLAGTNILVTGPNGFSQLAAFVSAAPNTNGPSIVASYTITPPGGAWSTAANGTYTIAMQANQVKDTSGNAVPAGSLGTFTVAIPAPLFFTSPPIAAFQSNTIGVVVQFSAAASSGTISWNFGD